MNCRGPHSNSERSASSGHCGDGGMQFYFVNSPFTWSCVQVCDVVDDFCFLMVSLCSKLVSCKV